MINHIPTIIKVELQYGKADKRTETESEAQGKKATGDPQSASEFGIDLNNAMLTQAIEKHDGLAQCLLGMNSLDNPKFSPRFGMHLLMKGVVDGGGVSYYHLHRIAMNYAQGTGVAKSAENAKRIAEKMIEQGYVYGFYTMGQLYQTGVFGNADIEKAKEYYKKGAAQGVPECIEALKMLSLGKK